MDIKNAEEASTEKSDAIVAGQSDRADRPTAVPKKKAAAPKRQPKKERKNKNATAQSRKSAPGVAKDEKLVCRYCGSDDLSPSFKSRRDARCRGCFKKRYASARPSRKTSRKPEK